MSDVGLLHWHVCSTSPDGRMVFAQAKFEDGHKAVDTFMKLIKGSQFRADMALTETALHYAVDNSLTNGLITGKGLLTFVIMPCDYCRPPIDN